MIKTLFSLFFLILVLPKSGFSQNIDTTSMIADSSKITLQEQMILPSDSLMLDSGTTPDSLLAVPILDTTLNDSTIDTSLISQEPPFKPWIQVSLNIAISAYASNDIEKIETATDTLFQEWQEEIQEDSSSSPNQQGYPGAHMIFPIGASLRLHYNGLSLVLGREAWQAGQNNIFSTYENTKEVSWEQWATQYRIGLNWDLPYSFIHFKDSSLITIGAHYLYVDQSILKLENQNSRIMDGQGYELQVSSTLFNFKNTSVRVELFWNTTQLETIDGKGGLLFPDDLENLKWENTLFGGRFQFLIGI